MKKNEYRNALAGWCASCVFAKTAQKSKGRQKNRKVTEEIEPMSTETIESVAFLTRMTESILNKAKTASFSSLSEASL